MDEVHQAAPKQEPPRRDFGTTLTRSQVHDSWQWQRRLLQETVRAGGTALRLNLDETSIVLNHDDQKGVVAKNGCKGIILVKKKSKKRGSLTHVVLICDDSTIQVILPQVIIGNANILRVSDLNEVAGKLPANVTVLRGKTSWVTVEVFIAILEMLRKALDENKVSKVPVLLLDGCSVHVNPLVWKAAKKLGILLCFVPAGLTWLVQPLDVRVMRRLKAYLRAEYRRLQIKTERVFVPVVDVIQILVTSIRKVLQATAWGNLFDECGYSVDSSSVCQSIRNILKRGGCISLDTPSTQPSVAQLQNVLPARKKYLFDALIWKPNLGESVPSRVAEQPSSPPCTGPIELGRFRSSSHAGFLARTADTALHEGMEGPIAMRTRSHSRILQDTPPPSLPSGSGQPEPSSSCPFSMSSGAVLRPAASTRRRRRAAAIPSPRKPKNF